jgi:starch phosphorylase
LNYAPSKHPDTPALAPARRAEVCDPDVVYAGLERCLLATTGKAPDKATGRDWFLATAMLAREMLAPQWAASRQIQDAWHTKRVYYLSMEFLLGRLLADALRNLGIYEACRAALARTGHRIEDIEDEEVDQGLGNGGLGRLAACLMDSLATLGIAAYGYGIRFEYGLFAQSIHEGWQVEKPDLWLRHGNPWEFPRTDLVYRVPFGRNHEGAGRDDVYAVAHDLPISGFGSGCVNTLRLWSAKPRQEFDTSRFNEGDHLRAFENRTDTENLTRVLYPDDSTEAGRRLRLKQEHFFVSASMQDILVQYCAAHDSFDQLPEKVSIQINDTHPALVVAELMRLLVDVHDVDWDKAWDLTRRTVSYTNHTLMPEALETWPVRFFEDLLPRHLDIIYRLNLEFLQDVERRHPGDGALLQRLSLIDDHGDRRVRMAHLAFVGSHTINGVSAVHTELMKKTVFADFHRLFPNKIVNVTNGVTPRRWLGTGNPALAALISSRIGPSWQGDLDQLERLAEHADDPEFRAQFRAIKYDNKRRLAAHAQKRLGITPSVESLFDIHVKRIHEYKRQLLKLLHVITLYNRIREGRAAQTLPRTVVFAGKAAPGYAMAKLIVKLMHDVANRINHDPAVGDRLKLLFLPNYGVSEAQIIIPAAELSEQISMAGTEASGTSNMKFALNGALTVGTLDGANIEISQAVGLENFFAFGLTVDGIDRLMAQGYDPRVVYEHNGELRKALDMIADGFFSADEPARFKPIVDSLLYSDRFLVLADYEAYASCQSGIEVLYRNRDAWTRHAILNVARIGRLSSDRAIREYATTIWHAPSLTQTLAEEAERRRA